MQVPHPRWLGTILLVYVGGLVVLYGLQAVGVFASIGTYADMLIYGLLFFLPHLGALLTGTAPDHDRVETRKWYRSGTLPQRLLVTAVSIVVGLVLVAPLAVAALVRDSVTVVTGIALIYASWCAYNYAMYTAGPPE